MKKLNKTLIIKIAIAIILATGQPFFLMGCFLMREIPLTQGFVALVDDEDFDLLNQWKWYVMKHKQFTYAIRSIAQKGKNAKTIYMHRIIIGVNNPKIFIDHRDHDCLNNQKYNLRSVTRQQNSKNRTSMIGSTSKYLGVHFKEIEFINGYTVHRKQKWCAQIHHQGKTVRLGRYENEIDAALAYNKAAKKYHGEFANLNVV